MNFLDSLRAGILLVLILSLLACLIFIFGVPYLDILGLSIYAIQGLVVAGYLLAISLLLLVFSFVIPAFFKWLGF